MKLHTKLLIIGCGLVAFFLVYSKVIDRKLYDTVLHNIEPFVSMRETFDLVKHPKKHMNRLRRHMRNQTTYLQNTHIRPLHMKFKKFLM